MSAVAVLYDLIDLPQSENMNTLIELTNQVLNEYRNVYRPAGTIDQHIEGDIVAFADNIDAMPLLTNVNYAFPGMKEYVYHHIVDGIGHWDDWNYCSWVASGMLRFLGREILPPAQPVGFLLADHGFYDAMG